MDRRTFLSAGSVALCSPLSQVWADKDANAAEYYRKAFSLVPEVGALRSPDLYEAENQLLDSLPAAPINAIGLDLIKRSEPALREMSRGAALSNCDWGPDYFAKFFDTHFSSLMKVRQLAKLACLRASYSFQQKHSRRAIADLAACVKMGRHLGRRGPLVATLVQFAIEHSAIDVVAAYLPRQNAEVLKTITAYVKAWTQPTPLSEAVLGEKAWLLQSERRQLLTKTSKEAFEGLRSPEPLPTPESEENVKAIVKASGGTVEGLLKLVDAAAVRYDELASMCDLPTTEFKSALSAFRPKHARENPLAVSVVPTLEKIRFASDRIRVRFAMLDAAVAVVSSGPAQLKAIKDPFGDGPFEYRPFKGGFELTSTLLDENRTRATVIVGMRVKG